LHWNPRNAIRIRGRTIVNLDLPQVNEGKRRVRVLVVDDDRDTRDAFEEILGMLGHDARGAGEGWAALELAEEFEPDVVLLDLGMPGMSGYEIARELRRTRAGRESMLVAVTGWGDAADVNLSYRAGFDLHMTKPIGVTDLRTIIARRAGDAPRGHD
jgi:CheY-like chemotaxis protein